jgi:hypothetical protein
MRWVTRIVKQKKSNWINKKSWSCPITRHEGAWGERQLPLILDLGIRLGWAVSVKPRRFTPRERTPGTHCTGGWVGPRAGPDTEARGKIRSPLPGIEPRSPGRPACSQTLYWLSYPGSPNGLMCEWNIEWRSEWKNVRDNMWRVNQCVRQNEDMEIRVRTGETWSEWECVGVIWSGWVNESDSGSVW